MLRAISPPRLSRALGRSPCDAPGREHSGSPVQRIERHGLDRRLRSVRKPEPAEGEEEAVSPRRALAEGQRPRRKHQGAVHQVGADQHRLDGPGAAEPAVEGAPELDPEVVAVPSAEPPRPNAGVGRLGHLQPPSPRRELALRRQLPVREWSAGRSRTRARGPRRWPWRRSVDLGSEGRLDLEASASARVEAGRGPPAKGSRARRRMGGAAASEALAGVRRVAWRRRLPRRPAGARGVPPGAARGASGPGAPAGAARPDAQAPRAGPSAAPWAGGGGSSGRGGLRSGGRLARAAARSRASIAASARRRPRGSSRGPLARRCRIPGRRWTSAPDRDGVAEGAPGRADGVSAPRPVAAIVDHSQAAPLVGDPSTGC